ncbi:UbiA family prenyltransferase [Saccharopolyspora sp. NPDC047091]|uniref:UbiA family prenyltransferase n=1 Tax=Saccharopolyspora sp. NPDC047091 TaxID=3155924 RepID=UPI0033CBB00D
MAASMSAVRRGIRAHVETWRPYTTCYPAMVGIAGAVTAGAGWGVPLVAAAVVPALGWLSGHYLGDYFDRELDAIGKPQRPIPSGRLSPRAALACGVGCAAAAAVFALLVNWRAVLLVVVATAGIVAYSRFCKARGLSGNLVRGALTALALAAGALLGADRLPWPVLVFALVFLAHDAASNLVGTMRDVDGDRAGGYRSVPVRSGVPVAVRLSFALYASGLLVVLALAEAVPQRGGYSALATVAACAGTAAFSLLLEHIRELPPRKALRAHEILVAERLVLAGALIAGAAGLWLALAVLVPALVFSLGAQAVLRSGHEFPTAERREATLP